MKVQLFIPCFIDQIAPRVGVASHKLLQRLGHEVIYPKKQTCCGQAGVNAGFTDMGCTVLDYFIKQFSSKYPIVSPSSSCIGFLNQYLPLRPKNFTTFQCYELSHFINSFESHHSTKLNYNSFPYEVAFLKSCSSLRDEPQVAQESLKLLAYVQDLILIDPIQCDDECCGYGGSFSLKFPAIANAMARRKLANIRKTSATHITSADMSCLLHLDKIIKEDDMPLQIIHIAEILEASAQIA